MATRSAIATLTSIRCRPHSGVRSPPTSSTRGSEGFPSTVSARYVNPLRSAHSAWTKRGKVTNGVVMVTPGKVSHTGGVAGRMGNGRPSGGKCRGRSPAPPRSDAGLVQDDVSPGPAEPPNRLFGGGGLFARKDAYVTTHPVW